jgi:hypothetical protein
MPDALPTLARARPADLFAGMNGTERDYAITLEARKRDGLIADWRFEAVTLVLAPDCRYTPDFLVLCPDGLIELHETKGHWREDAKVKIRVAARLFPWFTFRAYRKVPKPLGGGWSEEAYAP